MPGENHVKGELRQGWTIIMERKREELECMQTPWERYRVDRELRTIKDIIKTLNKGKY